LIGKVIINRIIHENKNIVWDILFQFAARRGFYFLKRNIFIDDEEFCKYWKYNAYID
jgi:hypothetical protein